MSADVLRGRSVTKGNASQTHAQAFPAPPTNSAGEENASTPAPTFNVLPMNIAKMENARKTPVRPELAKTQSARPDTFAEKGNVLPTHATM